MFKLLALETYIYWLIGLVVLIILLLAIFLIIFFSKNKKPAQPVIYISNILAAFGNNNIIGVEQVQRRVRIQVKDVKAANLEVLKELTNGIFVTGDKFVLTFKENSEEIVKALKKEIK